MVTLHGPAAPLLIIGLGVLTPKLIIDGVDLSPHLSPGRRRFNKIDRELLVVHLKKYSLS
jgi:hypothetical protein